MVGRTQGFPAEYCSKHHTATGGLPSPHSTSWCSLSKRRKCTQPRDIKKMWLFGPGHLLLSMLHGPVLMLKWHFRWRTGVSMWTLACLWYAPPYTVMHCLFWHLSIRTSINLLIWDTLAHLSDRTTQASLGHWWPRLTDACSPHAAVSLSGPYRWFTILPSLTDTADRESPKRVLSNSNPFTFCPQFFLTLRTKCSLTA